MKLELDGLYWIKYNSSNDNTVTELVEVDSFSDGKYKLYVMAWDCLFYVNDEDIIDFVEVTDPFDKENLCFVSDIDGLWYKLPVKLKDDFYDWVDSRMNYVSEEDLEACHQENPFVKYRCLHPVNYMFKDVSVLKENK